MISYIIKIECTHKENLNFNNNIIRKNSVNNFQNPPDITLGYITNIFPYIKNIGIVYIKIKKFTKKYLNFFCKNEIELNENEFINFINNIKKIGFNSNNKNTIISYSKIEKNENDNTYKYIDIYKYYYDSLIKIEVNNQYKKYYNKNTILLNICKNIIV